MSLVGIRLKIGVASSLFLGGCLLSFFAGRWSTEDSENRPDPILDAITRAKAGESSSSVASNSIQFPAANEAVGERSESHPFEKIAPERIFSRSQLRESARQIEALAELDPERALRLAEASATQSIRLALYEAAFLGWGRKDPEAAIRAALEEEDGKSARALQSAFKGAGEHAEELLEAYVQLDSEGRFDESGLGEVERYLTRALLENGNYSAAVAFSAGIPEPNSSQGLLRECFATWAQWEPEGAMMAAMEFEDSAKRSVAYDVALSGWAQTDPGGLAEFASALPEGGSKDQAFAKALPMWVSSEPLAAADWLAEKPPARELDVGLLALVNHPYLAERRPDVAMEWAEALSDKGLRASAVSRVVKQWAATDRKSAVAYLRETEHLTDLERRELLALFGEQIAYSIDGERVN